MMKKEMGWGEEQVEENYGFRNIGLDISTTTEPIVLSLTSIRQWRSTGGMCQASAILSFILVPCLAMGT